MDKDEEAYERLNRKLLQLSDEKVKNARALSAHEQLEQEMHAMDSKERIIWNRLSESWGKSGNFPCHWISFASNWITTEGKSATIWKMRSRHCIVKNETSTTLKTD